MPVTLRDIAAECGLAVSTVSNILNNNASSFASTPVKQRVKATAERLGYRKHYLSLSLRTRTTRSIGLCLDHILFETRHQFVESFIQLFNAQGYEVAVMSHESNPDTAIAALGSFAERFKDGVVLFTDFLRDIGPARERVLTAARLPGTRVLGVGSELRGQLPCVDVDRDRAFADCVRRIERSKHRRVAVVYKTSADFRASAALFDTDRFVHVSGVHAPGDFIKVWPSVHREHPDLSAVFFRTDEIALAALATFVRSAIRVPDDLAVISFDGFRVSEFATPSLSTYAINFDQLGALAFKVLHGWVTSSRPPAASLYRTIAPTFISRDSFGTSSESAVRKVSR